MLQIDLSKLPAGVAEEFARGRHAREVVTLMGAPREQLRIARQNAVDHRSLEGLGRLRLNVSATAYHYWGRRLGYQCWADEQFIREFERDNPECRVKCGGTRMQVGYTRPKAEGRGPKEIRSPKAEMGTAERVVRFRKSYPMANGKGQMAKT